MSLVQRVSIYLRRKCITGDRIKFKLYHSYSQSHFRPCKHSDNHYCHRTFSNNLFENGYNHRLTNYRYAGSSSNESIMNVFDRSTKRLQRNHTATLEHETYDYLKEEVSLW